MKAIKVDNLSKSYKRHKRAQGFSGLLNDFFNRQYEEVHAVQNISFQVEKGEFVGYLGSNGAGKTSTLKLLSGILKPDEGSLSVLGHTPFNRKKELLRKIGFVMGSKSQLWWDLPAMDTFKLMQSIYNISGKAFSNHISSLSEILSVEELLEVPVRKLSLGERMKLEIMCSLLHSPEVVFLDEPTIGLDLVSQDAIRQFLKWYNTEHGATIILTSHYIRDIEELCERVLLIHKGRITFDGSQRQLNELYSNYVLLETDFLEEYLELDIAEETIRMGNRLKHLVHRDKVDSLAERLDALNCNSQTQKKICFEEALKIKMQCES
ncbi:MAG: ATP-binding cassette domain-containing protein [Candidatus Aegiribacteria sp.]|nr:ATP-binding cassette domain-containing protein [Candidatus Aegiribacteria sp.]